MTKEYPKIEQIPHSELLQSKGEGIRMFVGHPNPPDYRTLQERMDDGDEPPMNDMYDYPFKVPHIFIVDGQDMSCYVDGEDTGIPMPSIACGSYTGLATRVPVSDKYGSIIGVEDPYGYIEPGEELKGNYDE